MRISRRSAVSRLLVFILGLVDIISNPRRKINEECRGVEVEVLRADSEIDLTALRPAFHAQSCFVRLQQSDISARRLCDGLSL